MGFGAPQRTCSGLSVQPVICPDSEARLQIKAIRRILSPGVTTGDTLHLTLGTPQTNERIPLFRGCPVVKLFSNMPVSAKSHGFV